MYSSKSAISLFSFLRVFTSIIEEKKLQVNQSGRSPRGAILPPCALCPKPASVCSGRQPLPRFPNLEGLADPPATKRGCTLPPPHDYKKVSTQKDLSRPTYPQRHRSSAQKEIAKLGTQPLSTKVTSSPPMLNFIRECGTMSAYPVVFSRSRPYFSWQPPSQVGRNESCCLPNPIAP